ncbi:MAG: serine/threonine-protein kinase, partial [Anaerolineae bacterium]
MFDKLFGTGKNQPPGANPPIVSPPPVQATLSIAAAKERQYHPGDRIAGRYEVVKSLAGGMGIVYLCADHAEEGLPVALKTFKPRYLPDRTTRDRFLREGTIWVGLRNHPHIVRAYRVERLRGGLEVYLVLEWVAQAEGKEDASLRMWLQPNQPLEPEQSLRVALHIARGMNYAVTQIPGLVHRDLKPENILLGRDGNARVTDFGLASVVASLRASFKETAVRAKKRKILHGMSGTPLYMAPEQWKQNIQLDMRADIYAFGCILHEMLTGETAVAGSEPDELARAHLTGQTRHLPSEFPSELKALVRGCLAVELADRFQTWSDVETAVTLVYRRVAGQPPPPLEAVSDHDTPRSERVSAGWSYDA